MPAICPTCPLPLLCTYWFNSIKKKHLLVSVERWWTHSFIRSWSLGISTGVVSGLPIFSCLWLTDLFAALKGFVKWWEMKTLSPLSFIVWILSNQSFFMFCASEGVWSSASRERHKLSSRLYGSRYTNVRWGLFKLTGAQTAFSDVVPVIISSLQPAYYLHLDLARRHLMSKGCAAGAAAHVMAVLPLLTCCCHRWACRSAVDVLLQPPSEEPYRRSPRACGPKKGDQYIVSTVYGREVSLLLLIWFHWPTGLIWTHLEE